jgi:hypothetical protein
MPEAKQTATQVAELKKREADLAEARNALKTSIIGLIEGHIAELNELGFNFALVEHGAGGNGKKIGRPRKQAATGTVPSGHVA